MTLALTLILTHPQESNLIHAANGLRFPELDNLREESSLPPTARKLADGAQAKEWFTAHGRADIANATNAAQRRRMIASLLDSDNAATYDPALHQAFLDDRRRAEGTSHRVRDSGRYPLTGVGDVNTYALFTETFRTLLSPRGRAGMICPTGIATDDMTKAYFGSLVENKTLSALHLSC